MDDARIAEDEQFLPSSDRRSTSIVDARPVDYRYTRPCTALVAHDVLSSLAAQVGDVLRIRTHRERAVLVRIARAEEHLSPGLIRIDRFTRQALKAYPNEEVMLEIRQVKPTPELALVPSGGVTSAYDTRVVPAVKDLLSKQQVAVVAGMLIYVRLPHQLAGTVYDVHFVGGEEGIVTADTAVWLVDADHDHGPDDHVHESDERRLAVWDATFEDVGGLSGQIREIRESVELPLVFPQIYRQLGINPPRGVVFHGPPGTGKTLLARTVANEVNANYFYINGPEVVGTYSGETEANLRKIFEQAAASTPSIIMIDELDAIAPTRRAAASHSDARSVTQLLALLDGLTGKEGILAIGTTNQIHSIDPALRRAGRFDREVYFPPPSAHEREEILRVHTREMPLDRTAQGALPEIARRAHGFVGADLMELAREAGLHALRRAAARFVDTPSLSSAPSAEDLVVRIEDLTSALATVRPSALRGSVLHRPRATWADVGGLEACKRRLRTLIVEPLRNPARYARAGVVNTPGVLLYGAPGSGKSLLAEATAEEAGVNFLTIQGPELFSQWLGESEESVRHIFDLARRAAPSIVFFDQLDALLPRLDSEYHEGTRAPQRVANQMLAELDEIRAEPQVVVLAATHRRAAIDLRALRPGRFGAQLHVGSPDEGERAEILRIHLRNSTLTDDVTLDQVVGDVAGKTSGSSGADLEFICQAARLAAIEHTAPDQVPAIRLTDLESAINELAISQIRRDGDD